jgi:hypothetical protein
MKKVLDYLDERQRNLHDHQFFGLIASGQPIENVMPIVPALVFWVMSFQDALRINVHRIHDRQLKTIARHHLREDAGHDLWYLNDLRKMTSTVPDAKELFGDAHRACREISYGLLAEAYRSVDDAERIVLLLILESTGQVFFPHIVTCFRQAGIEPSLQYFAQTHLDVEKNHEIVEQKMHDMLSGLQLPESTRSRCIEAVDRCYDLFSALFDSLVRSIQSADPATVRHMRDRAHQLRLAAAA